MMLLNEKFKKIDNDHFEITNELTGEIKILHIEEVTKEFEQFLLSCNPENIKELASEYQNNLSLFFVTYIRMVDLIITDYDEEIDTLEAGYIFHNITITTEAGKNITLHEDSPPEKILKYKDNVRRSLRNELLDKKAEADNMFLELISKIDSGEKADSFKTLEAINKINESEQENIDFILNDLLKEVKIKTKKRKIAHREKEIEDFIINDTYKNLRNFIIKKMDEGSYKIKNADKFIITYIKSKKMSSLKQAYFMYKKRLTKTNDN